MKIITGATLIDGTGRPPQKDSAVLVSDDGRVGAVTFVGPTKTNIIEGHPNQPVEQQNMVLFDADEADQPIFVSQLEMV